MQNTFKTMAETAGPYKEAILEGVAELLWPTRCALCDMPGKHLCIDCLRELPFIDQNLACPKCGAPFGKSICTECNSYILANHLIKEFPLDGMRSALLFTNETQIIIATFKDKGEQGLAKLFGQIITESLKPEWVKSKTIITTIPMRKEARITRGYDHMDLIAREIAQQTKLPYHPLLKQSKQKDQRELNAKERMRNMRNAFEINPSSLARLKTRQPEDRNIIIIDDVFTTGSTLFNAGETLKKAGANKIYGATLARVLK